MRHAVVIQKEAIDDTGIFEICFLQGIEGVKLPFCGGDSCNVSDVVSLVVIYV